MIYDKVKWHHENDFPKELPYKNAGTHIGMFLYWFIINDFLSENRLSTSKRLVGEVKNKLVTGRNFLIAECNGELTDNDLNHIGNQFAKFYYYNGKDYGQYMHDYASLFNEYDDLYNVQDTWENYKLVEKLITSKYNEWYLNNVNSEKNSEIVLELKKNIFHRAKIFIENIDSFVPFGAKIKDNHIDDVMAYEEFEDSIEGSILINIMKQSFSAEFKEKSIDAAAIAYDVVMTLEDDYNLEQKRDALCLIISTDGENWENSYYPYMLIDRECIWR